MSLVDRTVELAQDQSGTFFLQRLMGVLAHYPDTISHHLMLEDIIKNIRQLVGTEPGSRYINRLFLLQSPFELIFQISASCH